jgi:hypothetical protein
MSLSWFGFLAHGNGPLFRPKWIILQPRAGYKAKHARFRYWRIAPSAPW